MVTTAEKSKHWPLRETSVPWATLSFPEGKMPQITTVIINGTNEAGRELSVTEVQ